MESWKIKCLPKELQRITNRYIIDYECKSDCTVKQYIKQYEFFITITYNGNFALKWKTMFPNDVNLELVTRSYHINFYLALKIIICREVHNVRTVDDMKKIEASRENLNNDFRLTRQTALIKYYIGSK